MFLDKDSTPSMVKNVQSITHWSKSYLGAESTTITFRKGFFRKLFNKPAKSIIFHKVNGIWLDVETGNSPNASLLKMIEDYAQVDK